MAINLLETKSKWQGIIQTKDSYRYVIPKSYKAEMKVDVLLFSSPSLIEYALTDLSLEQACNVACLPGIVGNALVMPDIHQGYGFPIGGVAAMRLDEGVVSPGGVGFDINCGVRLLTSKLSRVEILNTLETLLDELFKAVPTGAGTHGGISINERDLDQILAKGSKWALQNDYATQADIDHTEEYGQMPNANSNAVSTRAKKRGLTQLGTLGSGNHFLEIDYIEEIYEPEIAKAFGLFKDQICFMIHCGSRGLGHQVCTDYVSAMKPIMSKYSIKIPDRELSCCPINSQEGQEYLSAMAASANFAFANRQCITYRIRKAVTKLFGKNTELNLLYDVAHNMAKFETHVIDNKPEKLLIHRKGSTRAFPAHHLELPKSLQECGQPVIIPGDMGRASYILVGTEQTLKESFGSVCHGAGRIMSRTQARKGHNSKDVIESLCKLGVIAKASTKEGLTEEVPEAYKPIDEVIEAVHNAGLAKRVARLKPIGVIKG
jgi:tRNA-splicing ligase RtcB